MVELINLRLNLYNHLLNIILECLWSLSEMLMEGWLCSFCSSVQLNLCHCSLTVVQLGMSETHFEVPTFNNTELDLVHRRTDANCIHRKDNAPKPLVPITSEL